MALVASWLLRLLRLPLELRPPYELEKPSFLQFCDGEVAGVDDGAGGAEDGSFTLSVVPLFPRLLRLLLELRLPYELENPSFFQLLSLACAEGGEGGGAEYVDCAGSGAWLYELDRLLEYDPVL